MNWVIAAGTAAVVGVILAIASTIPDVPRVSPIVRSEIPTETSTGPHLCMPCVGPHLSFSGGIKMFSFGPGLSF